MTNPAEMDTHDTAKRIGIKLSTWLDSNDRSTAKTDAWLLGDELPAVGDDVAVFHWIVRGLASAPGKRRKRETELASRLALVIEELPKEFDAPTIAREYYYTLFQLCSEITVSETLFDPLSELYQRLIDDPEQTLSKLARIALRDALIHNQRDDRLWHVWQRMLAGEPDPVLPGTPEHAFHATRLMPPAPDQLGEPDVVRIGEALWCAADYFRNRDRSTARNRFKGLLGLLKATYPFHRTWDYDLIQTANRNSWESWAIDCLDSHCVNVPSRNGPSNRWILSEWISKMFLPKGMIPEMELCSGHAGIYALPDSELLDRYRKEIIEVETIRLNCPFFCERSIKGAIAHTMTNYQFIHSGPERKELETRKNLMLQKERIGLAIA